MTLEPRLSSTAKATRIRKENERVERVKQNILQTESYLKSTSVNRPTTQNSKLLNSSFSSVTSFISSMVVEQGTMDNDQYIGYLLRIKDTLDSKIDAYNELNSEYRTNSNQLIIK